MARNAGGTVLVPNTWTAIFNTATDGDARAVIVKNLLTSPGDIELYATPNDGDAAPDGPTVRYKLAPGEAEVVEGLSPSGGIVGVVYVRSTAAAVVQCRVKMR